MHLEEGRRRIFRLHKPGSIKWAVWLLYLKFVISVAGLALSIRLLSAPSPEERVKYKLDELTSGQFMTVGLNLLLPLAAIIATLYLIRKKKRIPAMVSSLVMLWFSATIFPPLEFLIAVLVLLLLFARPSKAYFNDSAASSSPDKLTKERQLRGESPEYSGDNADAAAVLMEMDTIPVPAARLRADPAVEIRTAGLEEAHEVHSLMMAAFEEYRRAVPPSSALEESEGSVREALEKGQQAAVLYEDGKPAASVRYEVSGDAIIFFRLSVLPARRRRGYAKRLVKWLEQQGVARGLNTARCKVRQSVGKNVTMYQDMGYEVTDQELVVRPEGTIKALTMEKNLTI
jgi:ribosomal protein S18 acetylase RimI-like enzyme